MIITLDEIQQQADKIVQLADGQKVTRVLHGKNPHPELLIRGEADETVAFAIYQLRCKGVFYERKGNWLRFVRAGEPDCSPPLLE